MLAMVGWASVKNNSVTTIRTNSRGNLFSLVFTMHYSVLICDAHKLMKSSNDDSNNKSEF